MRTLDVGCGGRPNGDVNIDLFTDKSPHTRALIKPYDASDFVRADASLLPFKDKAFDIVRASHVLEHLKSPLDALKEWRRVAQHKVIVRVPDSSTSKGGVECQLHLFSWTPISFHNLMAEVFFAVRTDPVPRRQVWQRLPTTVQYFLNRLIWTFAFSRTSEIFGVGFIGAAPK